MLTILIKSVLSLVAYVVIIIVFRLAYHFLIAKRHLPRQSMNICGPEGITVDVSGLFYDGHREESLKLTRDLSTIFFSVGFFIFGIISLFLRGMNTPMILVLFFNFSYYLGASARTATEDAKDYLSSFMGELTRLEAIGSILLAVLFSAGTTALIVLLLG